MRRLVLGAIAAVVVVGCIAGAAAEQVARPTFSDSFGFGFEDSGTSAYLGVDISEVTPERVGALKLKEEQGVEVLMVDQDSPAGKAGLKETRGRHFDVEWRRSRERRAAPPYHPRTPPGRTVTLGISRDGQAQTVKAQLSGSPQGARLEGQGRGKQRLHHSPIPPIPIFLK